MEVKSCARRRRSSARARRRARRGRGAAARKPGLPTHHCCCVYVVPGRNDALIARVCTDDEFYFCVDSNETD